MFGKSSEKYLLIAGVFAIVLIDTCYSSTFITPPIQHPRKFSSLQFFLYSLFLFRQCVNYLAWMSHRKVIILIKKKKICHKKVFVFASDAWYFPKFALERRLNVLKSID